MKLYIICVVVLLICVNCSMKNKTNQLKNQEKARKVNEDNIFTDGPRYESQQIGDINEGICFLRHNGTLYDLNPTTRDGAIKLKTKAGNTIDFMLCRNTEANKDCQDKKDSLIRYGKNGKCVQFAGNWNEDKHWDFIRDNELDSEIILTLPQGEICNNATQERYTVRLNITCNLASLVNPDARPRVVNDGTFNEKKCNNTIDIETIDACPKYFYYSAWGAVILNKYFLSLIFVTLGGLLIFFGKKIFDYLLIMITALMGAIIIEQLLAPYISLPSLVCLGIGIGLAILVWFFRNLTTLTLAIIFGYTFGSMKCIFWISVFPHVNPYVIFYISVILMIALCYLILLYTQSIIEAIVTSLIGSYFLVRGFSFIIGGFPDEFYFMMLIQKLEVGQISHFMNMKVILYTIAMGLVFIGGLLFQIGYFIIGENENNAANGDNEEKKPIIANNDAPPSSTN